MNSNELADLLLAEVEAFTEGSPITDDRTLVVMKVK
jgi:serine phosphatase RsbU (regulator of sigma subunit)